MNPFAALLLRDTELYRNAAFPVAAAWNRAGLRTVVLGDGDPLPAASVLVLTGMPTNFPRTTARLAELGGARPTTLVWQFEPLPPAGAELEFSPLAERFAHPSWRDALGRWAGFLDRVWPLPGELRNLYRRWHAGELERLLTLPPAGAAQLHVQGLRMLSQQLQWLKQHALGERPLIDGVACSVGSREALLQRLGAPAAFVPVGFDPAWGRLLELERDIDVLFLGRLGGRRRRETLTEIMAELRRRGWRTEIVAGNCYGEERTRLVNRARVVVNLLQFPWEFPGMRLHISLSCGALVVSETCADTRPWRAGAHFVPALPGEMPDVVERWLRDEPARQAFVAAARRDVIDAHSAEHSACRLRDFAERTLAGRRLPVRAA